MKNIMELSLYDLGAVDYDVWLNKNKDFGYYLEIESEDGHAFIEEQLHPFAADALADFCRRYLHGYDKLNQN
jgi:hypothetical protein